MLGCLIWQGFGDSTSGKSTVKIPDRSEKLLEHEDMKGPDGTSTLQATRTLAVALAHT